MEVENHKEEVPFGIYCNQWQLIDPQEASMRTGTAFDAETGEFRICFYGDTYYLSWPTFSIRGQGGFALDYLPAQILLMRFIMNGKPTASTGKFLTYSEMPSGRLYLTPFTGRCLTRAAFTFGTRLPSFETAMQTNYTRKLAHGDASYQVMVMEKFAIQIIIWAGDEEFPPNSQMLFSDNFPSSFSPEDIAVVCDILISQIKGKML